MSTPQNYMNSAEVARALCLTPQTILDYTRSGKLRASKVGRKWLYKFEDVERLVDDARRAK